MPTEGRLRTCENRSTRMRAALYAAVIAIAVLLATLSERAAAAVLEGAHILELTAQAMGTIATLQVHQKVLIYPQTPEGVPTILDETAIYAMPERFRSDTVSDRAHRTHLVFADSSLTLVGGRMVVGHNRYDRYQRLLRSRTRQRLIRTLNQMGVETAISSLGRFEDQVVFVLGARYPDESTSQLSVDQKTFLPIRLLLVDQRPEDADRRLEIVYRDWREAQKGLFPYQVLFYVNGRLAREIRVVDLISNPSIPSGMLDLEALKASAAMREANAAVGQEKESAEDRGRVEQDFQKKVE